MVQPLPSNSDNNELAKQAGVQQGLDNGSSNSGSMQSASADGDANLANGNNNQFNKVDQQTVIIFPPFSKPEVVKPNTSSQEASQVKSIFFVTSAILTSVSLLSAATFFYSQVGFKLNIGESQMEECNTANQSKGSKIVITSFNFNQGSDNLLLKERLFDALDRHSWNNIEICSTEKIVSTSREAKKIGSQFNAEVVIWGRPDREYLEISVEATNIDVHNFKTLFVPLNNSLKSNFKTQNWANLVPVMVAFHFSEIYSSKKQISKAQEILWETLKIAEQEVDKKLEDYGSFLGKAYFYLGLLIETPIPKGCDQGSRNECLKALQAYKKASNLAKMNNAFLKEAVLYERLENFDEAIEVYTKLLNSKPNATVVKYALNNRALVHIKKDEPEKALPDIEAICQASPEDIDCLRWLGRTQLQAGKISEAEETYKKLENYLIVNNNPTTAEGDYLQSEILKDLQEIYQKNPASKLDTFLLMFE
ncbi:MAG: tetratricopeptide repeat protein [Microcoleus vaginatus WJT46-NPBG5]|nr:tetratricopeptide repeat protein [Microcoleus vaginatus WJT46-NPBG5]